MRLEPLGPQHIDALVEVGTGRDIFRYFPGEIETPAQLRGYLDYCRQIMQAGNVPGPRYRHSVYFSVIESEWPAAHVRLQAMLA